MTDDYRLKQSRDQAKAIELRGQTKVTRAGDRDTDYGYQNFINPDGSQSRAGVKTYNAEIPIGTPVLATPRSDGLTTLQSLKATETPKVLPLATPPTYLKGKVFGYPAPAPIKGDRVYVLFYSQNKLYIGGHQETPEEVGNSAIQLSEHELWADKAGWVVSGIDLTDSGRTVITKTSIVKGPTNPGLELLSNRGSFRFLGFGNYMDYGCLYADGQWYGAINPSPDVPTDQTGYFQDSPITKFGNQIIRRKVGFTPYRDANGNYRLDYTETYITPIRRDRTSALAYYDVEDYTKRSGYTLLVTEGKPDLIFNQYSISGYETNPLRLPVGMYTDGIFTTVQWQTATIDINNLKSGPGLVYVTTQKIGEAMKVEQVKAFKIPADAFIVKSVSIAP